MSKNISDYYHLPQPECDDEWILRKAQGTYFLRIGEFLKKTRWPSGMFLDSRVFLIGNTKFKLRFYPNNNNSQKLVANSSTGSGSEGEEMKTDSPASNRSPEAEGFVGVYLYNESNFDVLADIILKVGSEVLTLKKQFLRANECVGWPWVYRHSQLESKTILNKEGKLEVRAEITTNWERKVDPTQALTNSDLLQGVLYELRHLREEMAGVQARLKKGVDCSVCWGRDRAGVHARLDSPVHIKPEKGVDCSVCWGPLTPPAEILQCVGGHVFCGGCYDRLEEDRCTVCQGNLAGRATGLENYLKNHVS